jgi:hypothetical protein
LALALKTIRLRHRTALFPSWGMGHSSGSGLGGFDGGPQALIGFVLERGPLEFHFFDFRVGNGQLSFFEQPDLIVDVVVFGHERIELFVGVSKGIEHAAPFGEFVTDIVVF